MAYSELIKDFSKIREYIDGFYVYGFKGRSEYDSKSLRSYDNERRRIESWLGEYMTFRQNSDGKSVFVAVDSRSIPSNPLYNVFKAKSFTSNDITLHFCVIDILADNSALTVGEIEERLFSVYFSAFENPCEPDRSTLRKKLKEYEELGILESKKQGNKLLYSLSRSDVELEKWRDALEFFSEISPLGVVGSYLLDKTAARENIFCFKHHYILHALESEVLYTILCAITDGRNAELEACSSRTRKISKIQVVPLKIKISTQGGRSYLVCWNLRYRRMTLCRLDSIRKVKILDKAENLPELKESERRFSSHIWGASTGKGYNIDHVEMTVFVGDSEDYILNRLNREKRGGTLSEVDKNHYKLTFDVYDAMEMLPWLRTFIGRITSLSSTNDELVKTFYEDLNEMKAMYGGGEDAV